MDERDVTQNRETKREGTVTEEFRVSGEAVVRDVGDPCRYLGSSAAEEKDHHGDRRLHR